ncbi:histone H3-like centromeric protein cpar-1 isoform X3 [Bombus pyrosoma]|uniref:histone H3-like centromeric protein cpar-1 isoform X3 n=1 Tax=Bombus pyrosoma TaxID=396416 RepID=UPI001CB8E588|nr:histone H3-like centromeric protein cpar-1 isoform X3 [Bombus pyrosoma]
MYVSIDIDTILPEYLLHIHVLKNNYLLPACGTPYLSRSIGSSRTAGSNKSRTDVLVDRRKTRKAQILKEIRHFRKSVKLLIPKLPFARLVKEIMIDLFPRSDSTTICT